jgi:menaquinone-dependent protoporphyrinogen oxidase
MPKALVVHASRHGATAGIAERIAETMRTRGVEAVVAKAADLPDPFGFDACVVGAGVYMGSWQKEGIEYLERYATSLLARQVWLFSSGPLPGSTMEPKRGSDDPVELALGPAVGPGSGGRRKIEELAARVQARDHRIFAGAFDPKDPPKGLAERVVRIVPTSQKILPPGDYRDWDAIDAWAREIAAAMVPAVPIA